MFQSTDRITRIADVFKFITVTGTDLDTMKLLPQRQIILLPLGQHGDKNAAIIFKVNVLLNGNILVVPYGILKDI